MSVQALRETVARLSSSAGALSAVGALLNARIAGVEIPSEVRACLEEVVDHLGLGETLTGLAPEQARPILGEIRATLLAAAARLGPAPQATGWKPFDPQMLQAAGDVSAGFPALLGRYVPLLDGLAARLETDQARFLDVGVGVAALAIEMARVWPRLRVVGIDVWAPSLALARQNVRDARVEDRVELREQPVQAVEDRQTFDLAWIPGAFIPGPVIPEALQRVRRSLRPGGWILFGSLTTGGDPLTAALARLRAAEWGSVPWSASQIERLLEQNGFVEVRTLPSPPASTVAFVAGRAI